MFIDPPPRVLGQAIARGFIGRCPACGLGRLIFGYLRPAARCERCGEALARYQSADFAPYIVTFIIGLIYVPLVLVLAPRQQQNELGVAFLLIAAAATALLLLPRVKGGVIGLLWALRVGNV